MHGQGFGPAFIFLVSGSSVINDCGIGNQCFLSFFEIFSSKFVLYCSVPDPKLIILDPDPDLDPQIENQELWFLIQIPIRILLRKSDGEKKFFILVNNKRQMG